MSPSGGGVKNLTKNSRIHDADPAWSPDGFKTAFTRFAVGSYEVFVMAADVSEARVVWLPDGRRMTFSVLDPAGKANFTQ